MSGIIAFATQRFKKELFHFIALPFTTRLLVVSFSLRNIAYPLIGMFTSAFIWKLSNDVTFLILYYIGNFAVLPIMFLFNAKLLRFIRLPTLYSIGTVLTGISALMVVFYRVKSPEAYFLYGVLYGIGNGIYWANRNFLTLKHTASAVRSYVTGLLFTQGTLASIAVPAVAGWLIVLSKSGYEILVVAAFLILVAAGLLVQFASFDTPVLRADRPQPYSPQWKRTRLYSVAIGAVDVPLYILPTVLVLLAIGNEAVLGTVTSVMAIVTAGVTYLFGRKQQTQHFFPSFVACIALFMLAGSSFFWGISMGTVLWYTVVTNIADNLIWTTLMPVLMDGQDEETQRSGHTHYDLIVDTEWRVNLGRVAVLGLFWVVVFFGGTWALRSITILSGITALLAVALARAASKNG